MKTGKRGPFIAGNWKMHKTPQETVDYVEQLLPQVENCPDSVYIAVPFVALEKAVRKAEGSNIKIGAQNMHDAESGAFTGEISASMLRACGAHFVLLGHSERRHVFGEDDAFIHRKVVRALKVGIQPIVCIGETLEQRKNNQTEQVLQEQLRGSLSSINQEQLQSLILAYEPVWAIGTGETATPEIAQAAHRTIREFLSSQWGRDSAEKVVLQYGGSVKPTNAADLMAEPDIDGLLVGGASLTVDSFVQIVQYRALISGN